MGRHGITHCLFVLILLAASFAKGGTAQEAAHEHADRARESIVRGEVDTAEVELRQAVALAPQDAECLALMGVVLGMRHKLAESDSYFERALKVDPADSATRRNLAWNQFELGQLQPAKENLARLLKQKPGDAQGVLLLGMVDEELKNYRSALRLLESVPDEVNKRAESLAALARAYYYQGHPDKAHETLAELSAHSFGPEGVFIGGQVAAELHDYKAAESLFESIWQSYRDQQKLGYNLALVEYRAGQFQNAQGTLDRVIAGGHESSEIYNLLAWCYYKQNNFRTAAAKLDKAIALDPADESNYLDGGMMLLEHHLVEAALNAADKALEVAPDSYRAHRMKALAEFKLGRINDAEALYAKAVVLKSDDLEAIVGLATAQLDKGDTQQAEETLKAAIARYPRGAILYQAYGNLLLSGIGTSGEADSSRIAMLFQKAIALDNSLADAHYGLGKIALREDRLRDAQRELEAAVKLDPRSSKNHYALAQAYRKVGRAADAAHEVEQFQSLKAREERTFTSISEAEKAAERPEAPKLP